MKLLKGQLFGLVAGWSVAMASLYIHGEHKLETAQTRYDAADIQEDNDVNYDYMFQDDYSSAAFVDNKDRQPAYKEDIATLSYKLDREPKSPPRTAFAKSMLVAVEDNEITDSEYNALQVEFEALEESSMAYIARNHAENLME